MVLLVAAVQVRISGTGIWTVLDAQSSVLSAPPLKADLSPPLQPVLASGFFAAYLATADFNDQGTQTSITDDVGLLALLERSRMYASELSRPT